MSLAIALAASAAVAGSRDRDACAELARTRLAHGGTIDAVAHRDADAQTPAHCIVRGIARLAPGSRVTFELRLPLAADWSGRYVQFGGGGFGGRINAEALLHEIRRGNAAAATDAGHDAEPTDARWALGEPERVLDYAYRSIEVTSSAAHLLLRASYGTPARYRYFVGCSNGGRQALVAVQRRPQDWDGVLAGAPAVDWTAQLASMSAAQQGRRTADDAAPDSPSALSRQFFRYFVHADPEWDHDRFDVARDLDSPRLRELRRIIDVAPSALQPFARRGGRVIAYHGSADALLAPDRFVDWLRMLAESAGGNARLAEWFRAFIVPGMGHCQGGSGPDAFGQSYASPPAIDDDIHDVRRALERWVERGVAPERLIAARHPSHDSPGRAWTQVLCPWPRTGDC